jgi:hypothetical protein
VGLAPNSGLAAGVDAARDTWRSGAPWPAAGVRFKVGLVAAAVAGPAFSALLLVGICFLCFVCNSPQETGPDQNANVLCVEAKHGLAAAGIAIGGVGHDIPYFLWRAAGSDFLLGGGCGISSRN